MPTKKNQISESQISGNGKGSDVEELKIIQQMETEKAEMNLLPGAGYLFNVKDKFLLEATRLNPSEIVYIATQIVRDAIIDPNRKASIASIFVAALMRGKIALEGKGRTEAAMLKQQEVEIKAEHEAKGTMFGGGI